MSLVLGWVLALALDGGAVLLDAGRAFLSAEDAEVAQNLELLQALESADDLELLQELTLER